MKKFKIAAMIGLVASTTAMVLGTAPAYGANFSFQGSFAGDADSQSFFFTADGTSLVNLRVYNYGGGVNAAGTVIPSGGFDPMLFLYDANDILIRAQDDGDKGTVAIDPISGGAFDSNFSEVLPAGNYRVVMAQFYNVPVGIVEDQFADVPSTLPTGIKFADGFQQTDPNFTNDLYHPNDPTNLDYVNNPSDYASYNIQDPNGNGKGCLNHQFCDDLGYNRTSAWALDILNVNQVTIANVNFANSNTSVPEPSDLLGIAVAGFAAIALKRKLAADRKAKLKIGDE
jgi:hypothetical protein